MKIIVCGSMTASKEMVEIEKELIKLGHEVILPEFTHKYALMDSYEKMHSESAKNKIKFDLIRGYFTEIKNGDAIFIVNIERKGIKGYIGGNSLLEMGFAYVLKKPIFLLNEIPEMNYKDEMIAMQPIIIGEKIELIK